MKYLMMIIMLTVSGNSLAECDSGDYDCQNMVDEMRQEMARQQDEVRDMIEDAQKKAREQMEEMDYKMRMEQATQQVIQRQQGYRYGWQTPQAPTIYMPPLPQPPAQPYMPEKRWAFQ
jgi:hypothetical protein